LTILATMSCVLGSKSLVDDLPDFPFYEIDLDKPAEERFL
jgi:hypothetical protein